MLKRGYVMVDTRLRPYFENARKAIDVLRFYRVVAKIESGEIDFKTIAHCFREFGIYHGRWGEWGMEFSISVLKEKSDNRELSLQLYCHVTTSRGLVPKLRLVYYPDIEYDPNFYDFKEADLSLGFIEGDTLARKFGHLMLNEELWTKVVEEYNSRLNRLEELVDSSLRIISTRKENQ